MNKVFKNSFEKGMMSDFDKSVQPNDSYVYARNARLMSNNSQSNGSLENVKGNTLFSQLPTGYELIGHTYLRDTLVIFTTNSTVFNIITVDNTGGLTTKYTTSVDHGYTTASVLHCVSRYENTNVQLLYIVDGVNPLRCFNIGIDLTGLPINTFDAVPAAGQVLFNLETVSVGDLTAGVVSYYIRFYTKGSSNTLYIGPSPQYAITKQIGITEVGGTPKVSTGKAFTIGIKEFTGGTTFSLYDNCTIIAVQYDYYTGVPNIRVLDNIVLNGQTTIKVTDAGQNIGEVVLEEISTDNTSLFTANDITTKDNILFAGGIKYSTFDVASYDARVYRFDTFGNSYLYNDDDNRIILNTHPSNTLYAKWKYQLWNGGSWVDNGTWTNGWGIPEDYNCLNYSNYKDKYTNVKFAGSTNCLYIGYISSSYKIYGAQGPNVTIYPTATIYNSYTNANVDTACLLKQGNTTIYTQPSTSVMYSGFQRGEVYRLGTLYKDSRGRDSFAKWGCDFLMPNNNSVNVWPGGYTNDKQLPSSFVAITNGTLYSTYSPLYLRFELANLPSTVEYVKPIRVNRTLTESTILGQGLLTATGTYTPATPAPVLVSDHYIGTGSSPARYQNEYIDRSLEPDYDTSRLYSTISVATKPSTKAPLNYKPINHVDHMPWVNYNFNRNAYVFRLIGTDFMFNKNISWQTGDYIEVIGELGERAFNGNRTQQVLGDLSHFTLSDSTSPSNGSHQDSGTRRKIYGLTTPDTISSTEFTIADPFPLGPYPNNPNTNTPAPTLQYITILDRHAGYIYYFKKQASYFKAVPTIVQYELQSSKYVTATRDISNIDTYTYRNTSAITHPRIYIDEGVSSWYTGATALQDTDEYFDNKQYNTTSNVGVHKIRARKIAEASAVSTYYVYQGLENQSGSGLLVSLKTPMNLSTATLDSGNTSLLVNYRRNLGENQYGGNTYSNRQANGYIASGTINKKIGTDCVVYATGDIKMSLSEITNTIINKNYEGVSYSGTNVIATDTVAQTTTKVHAIKALKHTSNIWTWGVSALTYPNTHNMLEDNVASTVIVPLESIVNENYRHDTRVSNSTDPQKTYGTREVQGTVWLGKQSVSDLATDTSNFFTQPTDLYLYNSVYSVVDTTKYYFEKPANFTDANADYIIKYSNVKLSDETTNSWLIFKDSNYVQADGNYGKINALLVHNSKFYFWQDTAFGGLSVNERAAIQSTTGSAITLGTGGVLSQPYYISSEYGCSDKSTITTTNSSIYWFDAYGKKLLRLSEGMYDMLQTHNVKSSISSSYNTYNVKTSGTDFANNEILFTFDISIEFDVTAMTVVGISSPFTVTATLKSSLVEDLQYYVENIVGSMSVLYQDATTVSNITCTGNDITFDINTSFSPVVSDAITLSLTYRDTLVFSERLNTFTSFYSMRPSFYIPGKVDKSSYFTYSTGAIWKHNVGAYATFYGEVYPTNVKVLVNGDYNATKKFDSIEYISASMDNDINIYYDTINNIRVYNDYQNTGWIPLTPGDITSLVRKERSWTTQVPRNAVSMDISDNPNIFDTLNLDSTTRMFQERITDKYCIIDMKYNNTNNYKFNIPVVFTTYRYSIR